MLPFKARQIAEFINGTIICGNAETTVCGVSIDSRDVKPGNVFFALKGEVSDGHRYLKDAQKNGASLLVVERTDPDIAVCQVVVEDTFTALQNLTNEYIKLFPIPFVAITGSSGKTTTKDVIASVLAQKFRVLKTKGNLNSTTGVPLTIFDLDPKHEIGVIEMSMSHPGEILGNAKIVRPETAVITNVGLCHIEFLKTQENIFHAKSEILTYLGEKDTAIINADDAYLSTLGDEGYEMIPVGIESGALRAFNITNSNDAVSFRVIIDGKTETFRFAVPGNHNVINCMCAIAVGLKYGLTADEIRNGLNEYAPSINRMEIVTLAQVTLINDTYNANPDSMKAAVDVLCHIAEGNRKIAVLCDMYELGDCAAEMHFECGKYAAEAGVDMLLSAGDYANEFDRGFTSLGTNSMCVVFENKDQLNSYLAGHIKENDTVLFKASRGMHLEESFEYIKELLG